MNKRLAFIAITCLIFTAATIQAIGAAEFLTPVSPVKTDAPPGAFAVDGQPAATIVIPSDAGEEISFAAALLQKYVQKISGAILPVAPKGNDPRGNQIVLTTAGGGRGNEIQEEGYVIKCQGDSLRIIGGSERGTLYGVCGLLEDHLGVHWYVPGDPLGECVPKSKTIMLPEFEDQQNPSFPMRWIGRGDDWGLLNRQNGPAESLLGSYRIEPAIYHTQEALLPHKEYFEEHPEYFALINGKRSDKRTCKLCYSNPDVARTVAGNMAKMLDADPGIDLLSFSPTDGQLWCDCEGCLAMDEEGVDKDQSKSRRSLLFYNALAAELRKTHPEAKIIVGAYNVYNWPPRDTSIKADPMLAVVITHYEDYCMAHPVPDPDCPLNRRYVKLIEEWENLGCAIHYYEYYVKGNWSDLPWPIVHSIAGDMPWYYNRGHQGVYSQFNTGSAWTLYPGLFMAAKLLWNVNADTNAIYDQMCNDLFGKAGPAMRQYYRLMEESMANCGKHFPGRGVVAGPWLFTKPVLKEMGAALEEARAEADSDVVRQRLEKIGLSYEYTQRLIELANAMAKAGKGKTTRKKLDSAEHAVALHKALVDEVVGHPEKWDGIVNGKAALLRPYVTSRIRAIEKQIKELRKAE